MQSVDPAVLKSARGVPAVGTYNFGEALVKFQYDGVCSPKMVKGTKPNLIDDKIREKKGLPGVGAYDPQKAMNKISKSSSVGRKGRFG